MLAINTMSTLVHLSCYSMIKTGANANQSTERGFQFDSISL